MHSIHDIGASCAVYTRPLSPTAIQQLQSPVFCVKNESLALSPERITFDDDIIGVDMRS